MERFTYAPEGVCSYELSFSLENGCLYDVRFEGGCPGNLLAIGKLLEGADARRAAELLRGNRCGDKPTSCADQLAIAIGEALSEADGDGRSR